MKNLILMTDSYKTSHFLQNPKGTTGIFSYIESRGGGFKRTLFFGLQIFLIDVLQYPITQKDIDEAEDIILKHGLIFNREGWEHILKDHDGILPLKIKAVEEGSLVPTSNVLVTVENTCPRCFWVTSYIETALVRAVWYPTTVATLSFECKQIIKKYMEKSCDSLDGLDFKLHEFGARGVSSEKSAIIGGSAHLINFKGSDTLEAIRAANFYYNTKMSGFSIPAAEHSTICAWGRDSEDMAYENMLDKFAGPGKVVSIVSDSYDIYNACEQIWGRELKEKVIKSGATIVIRLDSGDPGEVVLRCLKILADKFGYTINSKGYRVLNHVRILQGDGISIDSLRELCWFITENKWSLDNVNFGMGGGLLQQLNRDTCQFAMKCSAVRIDLTWFDVYKKPATDKRKNSKRGLLSLYQKGHGRFDPITLNRREFNDISEDKREHLPELLVPVFENGKILLRYTLNAIRSKVMETL